MKIATLGPAGTNHDLNTRRYIEFHGLVGAEVVFIDDFLEGVDMMRRREVDLMIQVCAHHRVADTIEAHHKEVFLIDCFIGRTHPMGLLTRAEVESPMSVGYIPPTAGYFDPSRFPTQVHTLSNADTARRLLAGEFDSGFTSLDVARDNPGAVPDRQGDRRGRRGLARLRHDPRQHRADGRLARRSRAGGVGPAVIRLSGEQGAQ